MTTDTYEATRSWMIHRNSDFVASLLSARERHLVELRYPKQGKPVTFKEIAGQLGVSPGRASQINKKILEKLGVETGGGFSLHSMAAQIRKILKNHGFDAPYMNSQLPGAVEEAISQLEMTKTISFNFGPHEEVKEVMINGKRYEIYGIGKS